MTAPPRVCTCSRTDRIGLNTTGFLDQAGAMAPTGHGWPRFLAFLSLVQCVLAVVEECSSAAEDAGRCASTDAVVAEPVMWPIITLNFGSHLENST